jgi:hypothetical protein
MVPGSMTSAEMAEFCEHMQQLAMHAGHALGDAKRGAPRSYAPCIETMMAATRFFYRATKRFEQEVAALAPQEVNDV